MRILITGAAGMLGRDLVSALRSQHELFGVGLGSGDKLPISYAEIDLCDEPQVEAYWEKIQPELVFHLAAITDVDSCEKEELRERVFQSNTGAVEVVARVSKKLNAPVVFISTDFVFDGAEKREYGEEDLPNPLSVYGQSKAEAENALRSAGGEFVIFRICWLYGLFGKSFPRAILQAAKKQRSLKVVQDQMGRPTYTRDICAAFRKMLEQDPKIFSKKSGNIFHLANSGTASWADFAEEILKASQDQECEVERIGWRELNPPRLARRPEHAVLALEKIKGHFGIELRHWTEAVAEFVPELRQELNHP